MRDRRKRQLTPEAASEMGKKSAANAIRLADKPGNLRTSPTLRDFTRVGSDYYPDLSAHYAKAIEKWYETCLAESPE